MDLILGAARPVVSTVVGSHNVKAFFLKHSFLLLKCFEMRGLFVFLCISVYNCSFLFPFADLATMQTFRVEFVQMNFKNLFTVVCFYFLPLS